MSGFLCRTSVNPASGLIAIGVDMLPNHFPGNGVCFDNIAVLLKEYFLFVTKIGHVFFAQVCIHSKGLGVIINVVFYT